ncbi:hypothetical protein, partial [Cetobacterium sp. ZWU0022]|uniref:hypothetical protein n=1 Tax=Cetobacterium sp. ZWU0022 TaxID=1340502 RepID=UPI00068FEC15
MTIKDIIDERRNLHKYHDKIYEDMMEGINSRLLETKNLKDDVSKQFLEACAMDISGEVIRNFFDMSDYNLTVDQLIRRILDFKYENEFDPLASQLDLRKNIYNMSNSKDTINKINKELEDSKIKLFEKENKKYVDSAIIQKGKKDYKNQKIEDDKLQDETGKASVEKLQVDHKIPLATIHISTKFLKNSGIEKLKEFYNSPDNFAMLGSTANQCKGDAKVLNEKGEDITSKATPEQMTEAIIKKLEGNPKTRKESTNEKLKNDGILDEDGKVYPHIKRKIYEQTKAAQNKESIEMLKQTDSLKVAKESAKYTKQNIHKILVGQALYYLTPPLIYEIRINLNKNNKIESILENLEKSSDRIINYIISKKTEIMLSVGEKSLKKFLKNIFDILISMIRATIKKIIKIIKQVVLISVDAIKIMLDKNRSKAEKMDAILQLVSGLVISVVCEILFEYIEKQFGIPEVFLMPLQMLTTIVCSNFIMITLQEADLFSVRYGYKIENIQKIFKEEQENYDNQFEKILNHIDYSNTYEIDKIKNELLNLKQEISNIDVF